MAEQNPPIPVEVNVVVNQGVDGIERLTTNSSVSSDGTMVTPNAEHGTSTSQGEVSGNLSGGGSSAQSIDDYEKLNRERRELQSTLARTERRMADILRRPAHTQRTDAGSGLSLDQNQRAAAGSGLPLEPVSHRVDGGSASQGTVLAEANRVDGTVFASLKGRLEMFMTNFKDTYKPDLRLSNKKFIIQSTKRSLDNLKTEYEKTHNALLATGAAPERRREWSSQFTEGLEYVEEALEKLNDNLREIESAISEESLDTEPSYANSGAGRWQGPRIPEMRMPTFGGTVTEYATWERLFEQIVGARPDMNGAAKMGYLLNSVEPKVAKLINRLDLSTAGYNAARKLLKKKFGRKDLLVAAEIQTLYSTPKPPEGESSPWESQMQDVITYAEQVRDTVDKLANKEVLGDIFLQKIITDKMPTWMYKCYSLKLAEENKRLEEDGSELTWGKKTDHLIEFVEGRLATSMDVDQKNATVGENHGAKKIIQKEKIERPVRITSSTAAFATGAVPGARVCVFCGQEGHKHELCSKLKSISPQEAAKIASAKRACKKCLEIGHTTAMCNTDITCGACNKPHNTVLHFPTKE